MNMKARYALFSVLVVGYGAYHFISIENRETLCRVSCEEKGIYEYVFRPESTGGGSGLYGGPRPEVCRCITPEQIEREKEKFEGMRRVGSCVAYLEEKYGDKEEVLHNISECEEWLGE